MREWDLWPVLRAYWHPVAFAEAVGEKPLAVRLLDERIAVCRLGGRAVAFHDLCIHRGTPISLGWVEGEHVVCAYHGWAYDAGGKCVRIPSVPPGHPIPKKACLTRYPTQERYGLVWVCLDEKPRAPIPEFPMLEAPDVRWVYRDRRIWNCSAARAIENFLDLGHLPWVHEGILGDREHPLTPDIDVVRDGEEIRFTVDQRPDKSHDNPFQRIYRVNRPFAVSMLKEEADGNAELLIFVCTPHTARESTRCVLIGRNHEPPSEAARIETFNNTIIEQDRTIVENQRPEELPLDLTEELHLKGPDAPALGYRRMMRELGVE